MIEIAPHNSPSYLAAVELRRLVLRLPLGLDFTEAELAQEAEQVHMVDMELGTAVACLSLVPQEKSVKMRQVAVEPARQGQGRGRALVEFSEAWATEHRFETVMLHARATAVPFYLALGYAVIGEPFTEVGLPHRAMQKRLANP